MMLCQVGTQSCWWITTWTLSLVIFPHHYLIMGQGLTAANIIVPPVYVLMTFLRYFWVSAIPELTTYPPPRLITWIFPLSSHGDRVATPQIMSLQLTTLSSVWNLQTRVTYSRPFLGVSQKPASSSGSHADNLPPWLYCVNIEKY